jgi:alpha-glucosidase
LNKFEKKKNEIKYKKNDVVEEMKEVISLWMDKGVEGLRVEEIKLLLEVNVDGRNDWEN